MSGTIAITGATGFIGGVLTKRLASSGWNIRALVRPESMHKRPAAIASTWIAGDLKEIDSLRHLVNGVDVVVHCAGAVRGTSQQDFASINVDGAERLVLAAAEQCPMPRFLLISSLAAREPHLSDYAASKRKGEEILASQSGEMPWGIFRPPAVYGPGDREMLPLFQWMARGIAPVIGSEKNRIALLYAEDLAEAVVCWLHHGNRPHCRYELQDGREGGYSWEDIVDAVSLLKGRFVYRVKIPVAAVRLAASLNLMAARLSGIDPMLTPGKVRELTHPNWVGNNTAIFNDTGWTPKVTLEEGLKQTIGR